MTKSKKDRKGYGAGYEPVACYYCGDLDCEPDTGREIRGLE